QSVLCVALEGMLHQHLMAAGQARVREQLTEGPLLARQWVVDGDLLWGMLQAPRDAFQRNIGTLGNFLRGWIPAMLYNEGIKNLVHASHVVATIFWQPHQGLRGAGTVNSLANPPDGIGA